MAKSKANEWLTQDKLTLLNAWARDGLKDEDIAAKIGIVPSTLYVWKNKYQEFSEALKKGKEIVDIEVENSLLKKSLGFKETEQKIVMKKTVLYEDGKRLSETNEPILVEVTNYYPPETTAIIFWLKNRKPEQWRDKAVDTDKEETIANAKELLVKIKRVANE